MLLCPILLALEARTLEGEHDFCLGIPLEEDKWAGLPLDADAGFLGGASWDDESISEGFDCLHFTVWETPRDDTGFFSIVEPFFLPDEDWSEADALDVPHEVAGLRIGV